MVIINLNGKWELWGGAVLKNSGVLGRSTIVRGTYNEDNGEIDGELKRNIFEGFWIEDNSSQRCDTPRNGRYFWGRFRFQVKGEKLEGNWGYCNEALTSSSTAQKLL